MDKEILDELMIALRQLRIDRKPTNRGIMLLTAFLGSLMLTTGDLKEKQDTFEFLFWLTHNGDGTPITPEHRSS